MAWRFGARVGVDWGGAGIWALDGDPVVEPVSRGPAGEQSVFACGVRGRVRVFGGGVGDDVSARGLRWAYGTSVMLALTPTLSHKRRAVIARVHVVGACGRGGRSRRGIPLLDLYVSGFMLRC